jgi:hypothetical protein
MQFVVGMKTSNMAYNIEKCVGRITREQDKSYSRFHRSILMLERM